MEFEYFEILVQEASKLIPEKFKEILDKENIEIIPREKMPIAVKNKFKRKIIFGTFTGIPYNRRSVFNVQGQSTRIELYKESFERVYNTAEDIKGQIIRTVIHEIAHYFGFTEKEIRERGY